MLKKKRKNKDQKFSGLGHKFEIMTRIWAKVGFPSPGWGWGLKGPWTWDLQGLTWDHPRMGPACSGYLGSAWIDLRSARIDLKSAMIEIG